MMEPFVLRFIRAALLWLAWVHRAAIHGAGPAAVLVMLPLSCPLGPPSPCWLLWQMT